MKILIVSDTHSRDTKVTEAIRVEKPFDYLIHCGDVEGREYYIQELAGCPCCMVSGNNDFFSDLNREEEITLSGKRILVTHGHWYGVSMDLYGLADEAKARNCQIAMFGHTHKPVVEERGGVLLVNPGSLSYPRQESRIPSYAVMELSRDGKAEVTIKYLER